MPGRALVLFRTLIRTRVRSFLDDGRRVLALLLASCLAMVLVSLTLPPSHALGTSIASESPPVSTLASALTIVALVGVYGGIGEILRPDSDAAKSLVWTSVRPATAILGHALAGFAKLAGLLLALLGVPLLALAAGAGDPLVSVRLVVAALPLLWVGVLVGRSIGLVGQRYYRRVGVSNRLGTVAAVVAVGGALVLWMEVARRELVVEAVAVVQSAFAAVPVDPYVRIAVLWPRLDASVVGVASVVAVVLAGVAVTVGAVRVEASLERRGCERRRRTRATSRAVPRVARLTPSAPIAWHYLLLGARNPKRFAHLAPLLNVLLVGLAAVATQPGVIVHYGLESSVVLGLALAGGLFCLNPLGADRDQHALVLASVPAPAVLLRARALAGILAGLLPVLFVGVPAGILDGRPGDTFALFAAALPLFAAGAGTAMGFGAAVPRYDRAEIGSAIQTSTVVTMGYLFGSFVVGLVGVVLVQATLAADVFDVWSAVAWALFCVIVGGSGYGGYRYARRRLERLSLDEY